MPYLNFYVEQLDFHKNDVHVLFWNRDCQSEILPSNLTIHEFTYAMEDDIPKSQKLNGFRKYRKFAKKVLEREKPDFLIILHSLPGVLLHNSIVRNYRNRFIFDYRDYTYEDICLYRRIIHSLVMASRITFVSSNGFRNVLPLVDKIYTSHNLFSNAMTHRQERNDLVRSPIRISFWGFIRHEELNRKLINRLTGDERFELHYYGREQTIARSLKVYAQQLHADNVFFHGSYSPGEQDNFARETDLIHNIYSNSEAPSQVYAMTNKYYDGLVYRIPQLCMRDSYMGELVEKQGIGMLCDPEDNLFADKVWLYYQKLDRTRFNLCCDNILNQVYREYNEGKDIVSNAISG